MRTRIVIKVMTDSGRVLKHIDVVHEGGMPTASKEMARLIAGVEGYSSHGKAVFVSCYLTDITRKPWHDYTLSGGKFGTGLVAG